MHADFDILNFTRNRKFKWSNKCRNQWQKFYFSHFKMNLTMLTSGMRCTKLKWILGLLNWLKQVKVIEEQMIYNHLVLFFCAAQGSFAALTFYFILYPHVIRGDLSCKIIKKEEEGHTHFLVKMLTLSFFPLK